MEITLEEIAKKLGYSLGTTTLYLDRFNVRKIYIGRKRYFEISEEKLKQIKDFIFNIRGF